MRGIPNTPENREKFAAQAKLDLAALQLKDGVVEPWEDGCRAAASHRQIVNAPADEFSAATTGCDVRIGANTVSGDLDRYEMHLEVGGLTADLVLKRGAPSWRTGAGITVFDQDRTHFLAWVVPVPYGTVTASLTEGGATKYVFPLGQYNLPTFYLPTKDRVITDELSS